MSRAQFKNDAQTLKALANKQKRFREIEEEKKRKAE